MAEPTATPAEPTTTPADPMVGLRRARIYPTHRRPGRDEYLTDTFHFLVRDAVERPEAWMNARVEGEGRPSATIENALRAWSDVTGAEGEPVFLAGVWSDVRTEPGDPPFDPATADPKTFRARFVTAAGDFVADYDASLLRGTLRALGPVERMTQGGLRNPLVFWRDGLIAGAMGAMRTAPHVAEGRMIAGVAGRLPEVDPLAPDGLLRRALKSALSSKAQGPLLDTALARFAEAMGGVREADGRWLVPTRVGAVRLGSEGGTVACLRFARPRAAAVLLYEYDGDATLDARADRKVRVSVIGAATGEWRVRATDPDNVQALVGELAEGALKELMLAEGRRPPQAELLAEAARSLGPLPAAPGRASVLGPGERPVFVAMPRETPEGAVVPGVWEVLDRLRWRRLPGEGRRAAVDATVARLNAVARGP